MSEPQTSPKCHPSRVAPKGAAQTTLTHHPLRPTLEGAAQTTLTIAQGIAEVPRDGLQDQGRFVVAALEIVLRPALQLLDKGVQDHAPPPVRRHPCGPHAQRGVNAKTLRQALYQSPRQMTH